VKRALRIGILVVVLVAGGALAFAGAQPEGFLTVAQVVDDPGAHAGREIDVKATVVEGSLVRNATPVTFEIADGARVLQVRWDPAHPIPDHEAGGTIEGKSVVIRGVLVNDASDTYLLAHEMTVGCASKYRPAE
jgi:cytochrome c-type biogenesis protein CcmE